MSQNNGIFVQSFYSIITKVFRPRDGRRRVTRVDVMLHLSSNCRRSSSEQVVRSSDPGNPQSISEDQYKEKWRDSLIV